MSNGTHLIAMLLFTVGESSGLLSPEMVKKLKQIDATRQAEAVRRRRRQPQQQQQQQDKRAVECAHHVARIKQDGYTVVENVIPPDCVPAIRAAVLDSATRAIAEEAEALGAHKNWQVDPHKVEGGISQVVHIADSLAPYFASEKVLDVARAVLDPHVRVAQCEAAVHRPPNQQQPDYRSWHR
eukprot:SAG31_NODE_10_length_40133_cov_27.863041_31_plen_183_part_00